MNVTGTNRQRLGLFLLILAAGSFAPGPVTFSQSLLSNLEREISHLIDRAKPSVITIHAYVPIGKKQDSENPLLSFFTSKEEDAPENKNFVVNVGTGLYLHRDGYVVTRSSIVAGASMIRVKFLTGEESQADLLGQDQNDGIALLRVRKVNVPPVPINLSSPPRAGAWVFVVGNSLGVAPAVSMGNVSAIRENGMIQIAANIDPGSNGSPVLNTAGEVVGLIYGKIDYRDARHGKGVATGNTFMVLPMVRIYDAAKRLLENFREKHGWLGITVSPTPGDSLHPQISEVVKNSPAWRSDLRPGDVVLAFERRPLDSYYALRQLVKSTPPGGTVRLGILRGVDTLEVQVTMGKIHAENVFEVEPETSPSEWGYPAPGLLNLKQARGQTDIYLEQKLNEMERQIRELRLRIKKKK